MPAADQRKRGVCPQRGGVFRAAAEAVLLFLLVSVLPACGRSDRGIGGAVETGEPGTSAQRSSSRPPLVLQRLDWMGHWLHEDLREDLVRKVARDYSFLHPEIQLNLKFPPEIMEVRSKPMVAERIAGMIRSGVIDWDVVWLDDHIYAYVAEILGDEEWGRHHLVDFETVPGFAETQKEFIIGDPIYRNQTGGILVGPYIEGYTVALWYNRDLADRLGLQIKSRGMTFDDLLGHVRRVHEYNQTAEEPVAAFYEAADWTTMEFLFQGLVKSEIDDFHEAVAERGSPGKRAAMLEALEAFEELGRYEPLIPSHDSNIWFNTRHLVLEDEALFYVNGTWMYNHWRGIDPGKLEKMLPAQPPVFRTVDHALGGYIPTWAVMKGSPQREAAVDLVMWWSRPQIAEQWVRYTKNPTGLRGHLDLATLGDDPYERFQAYMTETYGPRLHYSASAGYLLGRQNARLGDRIDTELRRLLTGKTTARSAYESILSETR